MHIKHRDILASFQVRLKYGRNAVNTGKGRGPWSDIMTNPPGAGNGGMASRMRAIMWLFFADLLVVV